MMVFSFLLISLCCYDPAGLELFFWVSLFASVLQGSSCALGESTTLGFLKRYPPQCVGFFASGTGFAGVFATGSLILLKAASVVDGTIYLIAAPTIIPYILAWIWLNRQGHKWESEEKPEVLLEISENQVIREELV